MTPSALALLCIIVVGIYCWCLFRVVSVAMQSQSHSNQQGPILLLGKRAPNAHIDQDFRGRIDRAQKLLSNTPNRSMVLSGGGKGKSEALIAWEALQGGPEKALWQLETASRNTQQNLRNAKLLLALSAAPVSVISSRYHLARVKHLARSVNIEVELVAAEDTWVWSVSSCTVVMIEAGFLSLLTVFRR